MITMHPGFGLFGAFGIFPFLIFALVFVIFAGTFLQSMKTRRRNNNSPRVTSEAEVVAKRTHVRGDHAHTTYFATFQFESCDRLELMIPCDQFGYLVEGDRGKLTFQGTRFLSFERS